jgi:taurine transport system substrate-binding protein
MSSRHARHLPTAAVLTTMAIAVAGLSSIASAQSPAPSGAAIPAPAEIRIAYQAIPNGDLVVKHEGWLEAALPSTKITWTKFESGGDVNTAVLAGAVDIGLAGSSPVTRGLSEPNDIPYRVAWIHDVIGTAESLVARNDAGVTDVAGLKGKKIGTPFASTSHYSLLAALKEAGVAESDVTLIDLEPQDILAAWQRGDIQAAYVWSPTLDELKKDGTVLVTSAELAAKGYPTYDLAVVTNDFSGKYPAVVQEWLRQQDKAVQLIKSDPAAASVPIAAELSITPEEVQAQLGGLVFVDATEQQSDTFLGTPDAPGQFAAGLLQAAEFLKGQDKIDAVPTIDTLLAGIDTTDLSDAFPAR